MKTDEDITDEQLLKIARWDIDNQKSQRIAKTSIPSLVI
jgi:hypothetical protein